MQITKEQIEQRISVLQQSKDQHIANANAVNGAISEATHWLSELEKQEVSAAPSE